MKCAILKEKPEIIPGRNVRLSCVLSDVSGTWPIKHIILLRLTCLKYFLKQGSQIDMFVNTVKHVLRGHLQDIEKVVL